VKKVGNARNSHDEVVLDLDVRWCGNPTVVLHVVFMGVTLEVRLDELQISGTLRVVLADLDDVLPCFHLLKVAFVEQPDVRFGLSLVGGDIDLIIGVKEALTEIIGKGLGQALVWPKYVRVPIARKNLDGDDEGGVGISRCDAAAILEVTLMAGKDLANMSMLGMSDPFVTMQATNSDRLPVKSSVVVDDLSPQWNERFKLVLNDPAAQTLQLVVADYSSLAEDVKIKKIEKAIVKMEAVCCGWGHRVRSKMYQVVKTVTSGNSTAESGEKLAKRDTHALQQGTLFQTILGTGAVKLSDLQPFQAVERTVVLTKDALNYLTVFKKMGVLQDSGKKTEAGAIRLKLRLIPLASKRQQAANLMQAGMLAQRALDAEKVRMGLAEPTSFMVKYAKKAGQKTGGAMAGGAKEDADAGGDAGAAGAGAGTADAGTGGTGSGVTGGSSASSDGHDTRRVENLMSSVLGRGYDTKTMRHHQAWLKPHLNGLLYVHLMKGESLVSRDVNGLSDPYFKLKLGNQRWTSRIMYKTLNPVYNQHLEFVVSPSAGSSVRGPGSGVGSPRSRVR
jgi:hypothetical protein